MSPIPKVIDIDKVFRDKNPTLHRWMPNFILNYIKKVVHQDDMNDFLHRHHDAYDLDFVQAILTDFKIELRVHGLENIPKEGGAIVASNHPLGGLDSVALINSVAKVRPDLKFLVNDILMGLYPMAKLFVPVNKHGVNSSDIRKGVDDMFSSDNMSLIFPAGMVSRKQEGVIKDLEWKKTFIFLAKRHQRNVIPVYISGENSRFFYRLSNFRRKLGIKWNIEMLFLVDQLYQQRGKSLDIVIGKPFLYTDFTKDKRDQVWADLVRERIYTLASTLK